jgi:hypothetical protein
MTFVNTISYEMIYHTDGYDNNIPRRKNMLRDDEYSYLDSGIDSTHLKNNPCLWQGFIF